MSVLWQVFLKRIWILILAFIVAAGGAFGYCEYLVTPKYQATSSIMVTNGAITSQKDTDIKSSVSATDIAASLSLVRTVTDILSTSEVYRKVAKESGGKFTYEEIANKATVSQRKEESLIIDISYTNSDTKRAIEFANLFSAVACDYISNVIPYSNAVVVEKSTQARLVYPRTLTTVAGVGLGVAVVLFIIFFLVENNNKVIRNEEDFMRQFDIPIIGSVPDFDNTDSTAYLAYKKGK